MLALNGVDRSKVQEVPVGFDPRLLAAGKVDVYPVFESNEPDICSGLACRRGCSGRATTASRRSG